MAIFDTIRDAMMRARQQVKPLRRRSPVTTTGSRQILPPVGKDGLADLIGKIPPRKRYVQPPRLPSIEQMPRLDAVDDRGVPIFGGKDMFIEPLVSPSFQPTQEMLTSMNPDIGGGNMPVPPFAVDPIPDPITGDRYPVQPMAQ